MSERKENLEDPIAFFTDLFAKFYIYVAKELQDTFGKEGEDALKRALVSFGHDRGRELREKHEELGIPITVKSLFEYYDLPTDKRFKRKPQKLTENVRQSQTLVCPYYDTWKRIVPEPPELWFLYCDTAHQAIFEAYLEDVVCDLPKLLTKGDSYCQFNVYRKGYEDELE